MPSQAEEILSNWHNSRTGFPGWLIVPFQNRRSIFKDTRAFNHLFKFLSASSPLQRLNEFETIQWRCECSLKLLTWVLPNLSDLYVETMQVALNTFDTLNVRDRTSALFLATAQLRELRLSGADDDFNELLNQLSTITETVDDPDAIHRLKYQKALMLACRMDHQRLADLLRDWQTFTGDIYWQVRRACLVFEAGRPADAISSLQETIARIRSRSSHAGQSVFLRSREAYASYVCRVLMWQFDMKGTYYLLQEDDWDQYNSVRSNPFHEIEHFKSNLAIPPRWIPSISSYRLFDPHRINIRQTTGGDRIKETLDAREWLLFTEDVGLTPSFVSNDQEIHEAAFTKCARSSPVCAIRSLIRSGLSKEISDSQEIRCRIAFLKPAEIARLDAWSQSSVSGSLSSLRVCGERKRNEQSQAASAAMWVRSLIYVRLDDQDLVNEEERLNSLYVDDVIRLNPELHATYSIMWKRLIHSMSRDSVQRLLPKWLALPLEGTVAHNFRILLVDGWPDPFQIAFTQRGEELAIDRHALKLACDRGAHALLPFLSAETSANTRVNAFKRLAHLLENDAIGSGLKKEVVNQLHARLDEHGLPDGTGLSTGFLYRYRKARGAGGDFRERLFRSLNDGLSGRQVDLLLKMTRGSDSKGNVVLTTRELKRLLDAVEKWQAQLPEDFLPIRDLLGQSDTDVFRSLTQLFVHLSFGVRGDFGSSKTLVLNSLDSLMAVEANPRLLLARAVVDQEHSRDCERRLLDLLLSNMVDLHGVACESICRWIEGKDEATGMHLLSDLNTETLQAVCIISRSQETPRPDLALEIMAMLVRHRWESVCDVQFFLESCDAALERLHYSAQYDTPEWSVSPSFRSLIPNIRRAAVFLAVQLNRANRGSAITNKWIDIARSDPLPEVRRACE